MLLSLRLEDFVIVDSAEIRFGPGFTVLSGETGAGKSMLVDALMLAMGGRADAGVVTGVCDEPPASLSYQGAPPKSAVTLVAERYPLPAGLPARWTGEERGRIAQALWQHRSPAVDLPVATARGVSGVTLLPLEIEPDGCYVAAVASTRGVSAGAVSYTHLEPTRPY